MVIKRGKLKESDKDKPDIFLAIPVGHTPATIISFKKDPMIAALKDDDLIEYEYEEEVQGFIDEHTTTKMRRRATIKPGKDGRILKFLTTPGTIVGSPRQIYFIHALYWTLWVPLNHGTDTSSQNSQVLIEFLSCTHPTNRDELCAICTKVLTKEERALCVKVTHDSTAVSISRQHAEVLSMGTTESLLQAGKLALIVDLDLTLIHATTGKSSDDWINAQGAMPQDIRMIELEGSPGPYYIKFRPHLKQFLDAAAKIYEMHIYTMGTRKYAQAVANIIDPDKKYFSERIISRDENQNTARKSIERLFPCDDSMVVIIDDRIDVWNWSPNLVKVRPYEFFAGMGDINAGSLPKEDPLVKSEADTASADAATESTLVLKDETVTSDQILLSKESTTLEKDASDNEPPPLAKDMTNEAPEDSGKADAKLSVLDDNDTQLLNVLEILSDIHEEYYDAREKFNHGETKTKADVAVVMNTRRNRALRGLKLAFSSVIALGQNPKSNHIWRLAEMFGAICSHTLDSSVSHLVAAKPGTHKVNEAHHLRQVHVVKPEWLYSCFDTWKRQDESKFLLPYSASKNGSVSTTPPSNPEQGGPVNGLAENSSPDEIPEGMDENYQPMSLDSVVMEKHLQSVNWDDMDKEVEDAISDLDETDFESDASTQSHANSDSSVEGNKSPLMGLKKSRTPRRSGLGATVTYGSSDDDADGDEEDAAMGEQGPVDGSARRARAEDEGDSEGNESGVEDKAGERRSKQRKRRRVSTDREGKVDGNMGEGESDTMGDESEMEEEEEEEEEEEDDDDFFKTLEDDIDAQLLEEDEEIE